MIVSLIGAATLLMSQETVVLTLEAAAARALRVSPSVAAARGATQAPLGLRAESRTPFPDNPTLEYGRVRRRSGPGTVYDRQWSVYQTIEIGGQWMARGAGASALVRSSEARVDDVRRIVALEARRSFATLAIAERRAALLDSSALFAERLSGFATKQFEAGEVKRLQRNVVVLEAARARSAADRARAQVSQAAADLARLLALPRDSTVRASSLPEIPGLGRMSDSALLVRALDRRPDLRAATDASEGAERFVTAARLAFVPNLSLSAFNGREAGTDNLLGLAVGFSLPLVHRQRASIGAADRQ